MGSRRADALLTTRSGSSALYSRISGNPKFTSPKPNNLAKLQIKPEPLLAA